MKTLDVSSSEFLDIAESPAYSRLSFGGRLRLLPRPRRPLFFLSL